LFDAPRNLLVEIPVEERRELVLEYAWGIGDGLLDRAGSSSSRAVRYAGQRARRVSSTAIAAPTSRNRWLERTRAWRYPGPLAPTAKAGSRRASVATVSGASRAT
jgi:hypothetical protein